METETLILITPKGIKRKIVGKIISRLENKGLNLSDFKYMDTVPRKIAEKHILQYGKDDDYEDLVEKLIEGPVLFFKATAFDRGLAASVVIGQDHIPGTIRGDYYIHTIGTIDMLVYSSSSKDELKLWYGEV